MGNLKGALALGLGYWVFYCGVAQGGAFALRPWDALTSIGG